MSPRVTIIGAGPTGLACAYRLSECGFTDWDIYDADDHVGGLSASERDEQGFIWDHGGHVMFTRHAYFDRLVDTLLGGAYDRHLREASIWLADRHIPFPFQNNIHRLPPDMFLDCIMGVIEAQRLDLSRQTFADFITAEFGRGIAEHFMYPYNFKVWAHPLEMMDIKWQGDRVAHIDVRRILEHLIADRDDVSWGPNSQFKFPHLGTGALYERMAAALPKRVKLEHRVVAIDTSKKLLTFANGTTTTYDQLVSTMPVTELIRCIAEAPRAVLEAAGELHHTSGFFVGIGVDEPNESTKCWVYYPGAETPFYRVTYLSNYSPLVTPGDDQFSLLAEISVSPFKPEDPATIIERTMEGMVAVGLLTPHQAAHKVVSQHLMYAPYSYPVPTLGRDAALAVIHTWLMGHGIYSRGRFGAWCYEIGNADHAVMMGVELADHLVTGSAETVWTPPRPSG